MARKVVCRVRSVEADGEIEFTWSEGSASFAPYSMKGELVGDFRANSVVCRERLRDLVALHAPAAADRSAEDIAQSSLDLALAGRDLYNQIFDPSLGQACEVGQWLRDVSDADDLESLEIVSDGQPWFIPWNVVYDRDPNEELFAPGDAALEGFEPFWGMKYNLCGGLPVDPLRRLPLPRDPSLLFVLDPVVVGDLERHVESDGANQRVTLQKFLDLHGVPVATSKLELVKKLKTSRPHLIYWLGHAEPEALYLGTDRIDLAELRRLLRGLPPLQGAGGGLVFLNACQTAGTSKLGSFLKAFHDARYSGIIATEEQTLDNFANPFGLKALDEFLYLNKPIGSVLHELRRTNVPLGLLYGTYCPPDLHVRKSDVVDRRIVMNRGNFDFGLAGTLLGKSEIAGVAVESVPTLPLPPSPYLPLESFGPEHRALLVGRDGDVVRFALTLGRQETRLLVLHGESGVGKSSFLRAGLIPYLEEECIGFRFLRAPEADDAGHTDSRVLFIRATNDLAAQLAQAISGLCSRTFQYTTPMGKSVVVDLPARLAQVMGTSAPVGPEAIRDAMNADHSMLTVILSHLTATLPSSLVLVIDQAEEVFTLTAESGESDARNWALHALASIAASTGDFKIIVSLRTEYYGRLVSALRQSSSDADGVREYFLDDLDEPGLTEVILRPTLDEPIVGTAEIPRERYRFQYDEGVAQEIARQAIRSGRKDGVLPLVQVICSQLYDRLPQPEGGVITLADLDAIGGVRGGIRRHAKTALVRMFPIDVGDRRSFRRLFAMLHVRHADGSVTTALEPEALLAARWSGRTPFPQVIAEASRLRLLRVTSLRIGAEEERPYVSLGHDTLAKVAAEWDDDLRRAERIRKFVAISVTALGIASIMTVLAIVAIAQANVASKERSRAERNFRDAVATIDDMLVQVGEVDLADVPQMEGVRRNLLLKAREKYREFRWNTGSSPELMVPSALADTSLGEILTMLGQFKDAEASFGIAIRVLDPIVSRTSSDIDARRGLARAREGLAQLYKKTNRFEESSGQLLAAIELRSAPPVDAAKLAESRYQLGTLLAKLPDQQAKAKEAYESALNWERSQPRQDRGRREDWDRIAKVENNLAVLYEAGGEFDNAKKAVLHAIELQTRLTKSDARSPAYRWRLARSQNNLAKLLLDHPSATGPQPPDSDAIFRRLEGAAVLLNGLVSDFPSIPQYLKELADVEYNLGVAWLRSGDSERAVAHLSEATKRMEGLATDYPENAEYVYSLAKDEIALAQVQHRDRPDLASLGLVAADRHLAGLVSAFPLVAAYRKELRGVLVALAKEKALGDPAAIKDLAERLIEVEPDRAKNYILAAAFFAAIQEGQDRAVQILGLAIKRGLITSVAELDTPDFDELAKRPDYQTLLRGLNKESGPIKD